MSSDIEKYLSRNQVRERYGSVSAMTILRWQADQRLGFPNPTKINGRAYYALSALENWERSRSGKAA